MNILRRIDSYTLKNFLSTLFSLLINVAVSRSKLLLNLFLCITNTIAVIPVINAAADDDDSTAADATPADAATSAADATPAADATADEDDA